MFGGEEPNGFGRICLAPLRQRSIAVKTGCAWSTMRNGAVTRLGIEHDRLLVKIGLACMASARRILACISLTRLSGRQPSRYRPNSGLTMAPMRDQATQRHRTPLGGTQQEFLLI